MGMFITVDYHSCEKADMTLAGYKTAEAVGALGGEKELLSFLEAVARDSEVGVHEAERMIQEKGADISGATLRRWCDELGIEWQGAQSGPQKVIDRAIEALGSKKALQAYLRSAASDPVVTYNNVLSYFEEMGVEVSKPTMRGWLEEFGIEWTSGGVAACPDNMKDALRTAFMALMETSGVSTKELAEKIGVPEKIVRHWTSGQMVPHKNAFDILSDEVERRRTSIRKSAAAALNAASDIIGDTREPVEEAMSA